VASEQKMKDRLVRSSKNKKKKKKMVGGEGKKKKKPRPRPIPLGQCSEGRTGKRAEGGKVRNRVSECYTAAPIEVNRNTSGFLYLFGQDDGTPVQRGGGGRPSKKPDWPTCRMLQGIPMGHPRSAAMAQT